MIVSVKNKDMQGHLLVSNIGPEEQMDILENWSMFITYDNSLSEVEAKNLLVEKLGEEFLKKWNK